MYQIFIFLHSWLRWLVVIQLSVTLIISLIGWLKSNKMKKSHLAIFVSSRITFGIEVLAGLILYFILSPITTYFLYKNPGNMFNQTNALFTLKHPLAMILGFIILKMGEKRAEKFDNEYKIWFVYTLITIIVLFLAVPWPFYENGRPLFRL